MTRRGTPLCHVENFGRENPPCYIEMGCNVAERDSPVCHVEEGILTQQGQVPTLLVMSAGSWQKFCHRLVRYNINIIKKTCQSPGGARRPTPTLIIHSSVHMPVVMWCGVFVVASRRPWADMTVVEGCADVTGVRGYPFVVPIP